jgi:hypothetical protein
VKLKLTIIFFLLNQISYSQHIYVKPSELLSNYGNPGVGIFMHSSVTIAGLNIFDTSFSHTNVIRSGFGYSLMNSTSFNDAVSRIQLNQNRLAYYKTKTQNLIIEIAQTPKWVSTSSDTTTLIGSGWRYYSTVKPNNYQIWDSLMKTISQIVGSWGIQVNFEIWNEPDLLDYWNGSMREFLEMYIHTANALKSGNPNCRVGGIAVNGWPKGIKITSPQIVGWWPDSIANIYSITGKLIDTCYFTNTPLDLVTFHCFSFASAEVIKNGYYYFRKKLDNYGMFNTKILVTEYNNTSSYREATVHAPYMINAMNRLDSIGLEGYAIATFQDFSANTNDEFFNDYGIISRNAIIKPAYLAAYLIDKTVTGNQRIKGYCDEPLIIVAYKNPEKIKLLVANKMYLPLTAGYEVLYYGDNHINNIDLANAGYTNALIESTVKGETQPFGPPDIVNAFIAANARYNWALARYNNNVYTEYQIHIAGLIGENEVKYFYVDSTNNNNVFRYDSLRSLGYSNSQAISYLNNNPVYFNLSSKIINDSVFMISMRPNTVYYIEIPNNIIGLKQIENSKIPKTYFIKQNYPNPFNPSTTIEFGLPKAGIVSLKIFDIAGREYASEIIDLNLKAGNYKVNFDSSILSSGVYFYSLIVDNNIVDTKKMILIK